MKIIVLSIGKTKEPFLKEGLNIYLDKIKRYTTLEWQELDEVKNAASLPKEELKRREAKLFLEKIKPMDYVILLDERGKEFSSVQLSNEFQGFMNRGTSKVVFLIGGAFGFDDSIEKITQQKIALSQLTFTHQMIRLLLAEQIYRVFTILNNEKYHH
jgi:23S rRNA (pseudouridine1915-N3)-methyltransferase